MTQGNELTPERAIVYIDGFNLYFGLRTYVSKKESPILTKKSYWLDLQKLSERLAKGRNLVAVKYFTARIKGNPKKQERQNTFLSALEYHCDKLTITEGRYTFRELLCPKCKTVGYDIQCVHCGHKNKYPEEKKSDVNIATQMVKDAYENKFDVAYLVSGDSDLVPPIEVVRAMVPAKRVMIVFPPKRNRSKELRSAANVVLNVFPHDIKRSLLPDEITKPDGTILRIPAEWDI